MTNAEATELLSSAAVLRRSSAAAGFRGAFYHLGLPSSASSSPSIQNSTCSHLSANGVNAQIVSVNREASLFGSY
jgi:hypothetical protein